MALQTLPTYCSRLDLEHIASAYGVQTRLDDNQDGNLDADELLALNDCIIEGTETVNFYCWFKYDPTILQQSNWVNRKTAILACYALCRRRFNPVPDVIIEDAAKAEEDLKAVADGPRMIPNAALRRSLAPVMSLTRVDPRFNFRCIRVERQNSSQHNQTSLPQNTDYLEQYSYEIR